MPRPDFMLLCREYLFADVSKMTEANVPADTIDKIVRCRAMYMWTLENPSARDSAFISADLERFGVSRPTAYADLSAIKSLLPELSKKSREFNRWKYTEMILDTYNRASEKGDLKTMEKAASSFAKYSRLDIDEQEIDLADLAPQPFIPTMDPRVLGIEPIPDLKERKRRLLEKLSGSDIDIMDVEYEETDLEAVRRSLPDEPQADATEQDIL